MADFASLVTFAAILGLGIFVQSAAGFAAGMMIVPALLWSGYSIPEAQISLLVATIPQNMWGVWTFRHHVRPWELAAPAGLRLMFLPIGMGTLVFLEALPGSQLRQVVGGVLLAVTLAIMLLRPRPRHHLSGGWGWIAFSASGFLQGLVGMGGPAMVLWVQAHDWETEKSRGFLFSMYLVSLAPAMLCLWFYFGDRIVGPGWAAALLIPYLLGMTALGLAAGTWLGRERLRTLTLALLLLMGLAGICAPWLTP